MTSPQRFEGNDAGGGAGLASERHAESPATRTWSPFTPEARLLASSLRNLPLTLLHGSTAGERSALLQRGVLPLLGRRQDDRMATRTVAGSASAGRVPRSALWLPRGSENGGEHVVFIDLADPQPMPTLRSQLDAARGDRPSSRQLMVLEGVGCADVADPEARAVFWHTLLEELQTQPPALHLLIAADRSDEPALAELARCLPGFGDNALRLPEGSSGTSCDTAQGPDADAMAPLGAAVNAAAAAKIKPLTDTQWLATVHRIVERVAEHERVQIGEAAAAARLGVTEIFRSLPVPADEGGGEGAAPLSAATAESSRTGLDGPVDTHVPTRDPAPTEHPPAVAAALPQTEATPGPGPRPQAPVQRRARWLAGATAAGILAIGGMLLRSGPEPTSPAPAIVSAGAAPAAATAPPPIAPPFEEPGQALLRALMPLPVMDLRVGRTALAGSLLRPGSARLALVRYDALQTLPADSRLRGLRVVAPLFIEKVTAWVPADSPLHHWHQLRGRRLDIGAAGSGTELTAAGAYRALFGQSPPATIGDDGADPASLSAPLRVGFDASLQVGDFQAPAGQGRGMRALTLASDDPSTSALLRQYLPQALAHAESGARTPAVMSFLVVDGVDAAERERLAAAAARALCRVLPQLRANGHPSWALVRPEVAIPAGRPYADAAQQATGDCIGAATVAGTSPAVAPRSR